jgi:hypothetical protein
LWFVRETFVVSSDVLRDDVDFAVAGKEVEREGCVERRRVEDSDLDLEGEVRGSLSEDLRRLGVVAVLRGLEELELRRLDPENQCC